MRSALVAAGVGALALVVAAVVYVQKRSGETPARPAAVAAPTGADPRIAQLSSEIEDLRRSLAAVKSSQASRQSASPADRTPPVNDMEAAAADEETQRAQEAERRRKYVEGMAQSFAAEKVDPAWAPRVSQRIEDAIDRNESLRGHVRNMECRSETCRVQIDEDQTNRMSASLPSVLLGLVDVLPSVTAEHTDSGGGRRTMTLYMSSQRTLPQTTQK